MLNSELRITNLWWMTWAVSSSSRENVLDGILNQKSRLEQHTRQTTRPVIIRVAATKTTSPVTQQRSATSDFGSQEPEIVCPVGQAVLLSHRRDPSPERLSDRSSVDSYSSFTAPVFNCPLLERTLLFHSRSLPLVTYYPLTQQRSEVISKYPGCSQWHFLACKRILCIYLCSCDKYLF